MQGLRRSLFLITLPLVTFGCLTSMDTAKGQIIPDNTLGAEKSVVNSNANTDRINGGARRGANLFHSFREFSVREGRAAFFSNPTGVENIFSRVTGDRRSDISGTLGVADGNANLFFMNPNGIFFGPNARLDMRGSFLASTANSLLFDGGLEFSASNPQAPPMLAINIPIGLQFRDNPRRITNWSVADDVGLQVASGKTLSLVGGDVNLEGGKLTATGGRVELGGLAEPGTVGLEITDNIFKLNFPYNNLLANVTLADDARVNVGGGGGGDIAAHANILSMRDGGRLVGGVESTGNGGNITVNSNEINISGVGQSEISSGIYQQVVNNASGNLGNITVNTNSFKASFGALVGNFILSGATGNGGHINITAQNLSLTDGAKIGTSTFGNGNAGTVKINAQDSISLVGIGTGIYSYVENGAVGNAGDIEIKARSMSMSDEAALSSSTWRQQNTLGQPSHAGTVSLEISDVLSLQGSSGIFNNVESGAVGQGGEVKIQAGSLSLLNGSQIQTIVRDANTNQPAGRGNAGNVNIDVRDALTISGTNDANRKPSAIFSSLGMGATGQGGDINIKTGSLLLNNGAELESSTSGTGDAGNIFVQAQDSVLLDGSYIFSNVENGAVGQGGEVKIQAGSLSLLNSAQIQTIVRDANTNQPAGRGNAGNVNIDVRDALTISGTNDANRKPSAIFSSLGMGATGQGGDINIKTGSLLLNNGADLESSTSGTGNAGNIFVQAKESISLAGSGTAIYSDVTRSAVGNAGGIEIKARSMSMSDEAALTSSTWGQQNTLGQPSHAGKVLLQIDDALSLNNSTIFNNVEYGAVGQGGDIEIQAGSLSLLNSAQIQTIVRGAEDGQPAGRGDAGKVNIDVRDALTISGVSNDANKYYRSSINSILGQGAIGKGGDINIQAGSLSMKDGAIIDSSTGGQQDTSGQPSRAGDVTINVQGLIHLSGYTTQPLDGGKQLLYSSGISSQVGLGAIGNGGDVKITAGSLSMNDFSVISSGTFGRGNAGKVSMQVDDFIKLTNFSDIRSMVEPEGVGIGNDIDIKARSLTLIDGSQIGTTVFRERKVIDNGKEKILSGGIGSAGNIEINARDFINISGVSKVSTPLVDFLYPSTIVPTTGFSSGLFASAERGSTAISPKAAGNITVTTNDFRLTDGAVVNALTSNSGNAGNITINAKTFTATGGGQILTTTRSSGNAGDIILNISDNITLSGRDPNFNERIKQAQVFGEASDIVNNQGSASGIFGNTTFNSQGDGGKISIDPRTLVILDHAGIGVNSEGKGKGGDININSDNLTLDNHAFISAETASNQGGSIFLKIGDLLLLRRKSNISTNAGTAQAGGDGGDIKIDSDFIVALPSEDSNITANAFTGRGGNVNISATSIFGMKYRKSPTLRSDITASSQFGITGNVTLNTPNVDPSHGLVELPKNVVDPTEQIAQNPCQRGLASKFIITGRGGLPPSPNEATSSDTVRVDLVEPAPGGAGAQRRSTSPSLRDAPRTETLTRTSTLSGQGSEEKGKSSVSKSIVPAQGWIFDKNGEVMLTGYDPTGTGSQRPVNSDGCPVP